MIVLIRIGYIFFRGEIDREYYTSAQYELTGAELVPCRNLTQFFRTDEKHLYALELCFQNIAEEAQSIVELRLYNPEDDLLYQTNITLAANDNGIWKKIIVNLEMRPGEEYRIVLTAQDDVEDIPDLFLSSEDSTDEAVASYADGKLLKGNFAIEYGYLNAPDLIDKLVITSLWLILYAAVFVLLRWLNVITEWTEAIQNRLADQIGWNALLCGAEVVAAYVLINCSGIPLQPLTKALLYTISIMLALTYSSHRELVLKKLNTGAKKAGFAFLCLYTAFALTGQRIFIYPLDSRLTLEGLLIFVCTVCWSVPVVGSAFFWFDSLLPGRSIPEKRIGTLYFILLILAILLLPAIYNLIANNPGISDVDSYESFEKYAQNPYGMYNWHPLFYSLLLRQIQKLWNSTYAVILVHYLFWTYVLLELILYLRHKGLHDRTLILFAILFGFNASNILHLNTIWKDVPYTIAIVWLMLITAKLSIDYEIYLKKWYIYLELVAAMILVGLLRKNGIVPLTIVSASLLISLRKNIKLIAGIVISVLLIFYIKGPIYSRYQVIEPGRRGIYIGLSQDILGSYYAGGEVSEDTSQMIAVITRYNTAEYDYNPTWAHQSYELDVEPMEFIHSYIDTFLKNPLLMTRAVIDREDCLWDVFEGRDAIVQNKNYTDTEDGDRRWNEFYSKRVFRSIYPMMLSATTYTAEAQWVDIITWRCGLLTLCGIISIVYLLIHFGIKRYILIITPMIGQIISLLLSTGWTDFRYFWPMNLMNLTLISIAIAVIKGERIGIRALPNKREA